MDIHFTIVLGPQMNAPQGPPIISPTPGRRSAGSWTYPSPQNPMDRTPRAAPLLSVGVSPPPYLETIPLTRVAGLRLARGSLLVVDLRAAAAPEMETALASTVAQARQTHPTLPIILRVPETTMDALRLAHRASRMGVRAVVGCGECLAFALRPVLTRADDLPASLLEWLEFRGRSVGPMLSALVRGIVMLAPRYPHLGDLVAVLGESERTMRHRFQASGAPGPRDWHQGARALDAALCLQAEPDARLLEVALARGYSDTSGITRQITRAFGVTPAAIRGTLGWEWLAERWYVNATARQEVAGVRNGNPLPLQTLS